MGRARTPVATRERVGELLRRGVSAEGRRLLAEEHGVSLRTLWNWEHLRPGKAGRRPHPREVVEEATEACRAVLEDQGYATWWKTVWGMLGGRFSKYRVQECTRALKKAHARDRAETKRLLARLARISVRLSFGDVLWSLDDTHVGRHEGGWAVQALVTREVASTRTLLISVGAAVTAEQLVVMLEHLRKLRGALPLVVAMDNGPAMRSGWLATYLAFHEVVVLFNLPRTSQHNPWVERGHRRLKEACGLGKGVIVQDYAETAVALSRAVEEVDGRRPLPSRGMRTARAVDAETPRWYPQVDRRAFYEAACRAIREAVQECRNDRERRLAEREAVLCTLEDFALISRTRGGMPLRRVNRKSIS